MHWSRYPCPKWTQTTKLFLVRLVVLTDQIKTANAKKKRSRFSCILDELQSSDHVPYKTNLLEFINCLIIYSELPDERVRIRNEFYGQSE
ncbi:Inverted formin-2 [Bulinus truncatus]|nr:Inverted formin-2 [Bulinus truncatus]